jgi:hypothetical protein
MTYLLIRPPPLSTLRIFVKSVVNIVGIYYKTLVMLVIYHPGAYPKVSLALPTNIRPGACIIKHCGLVIYGKWTDFIVS